MDNRKVTENIAIPPVIWFLFTLALLHEMEKSRMAIPILGIGNNDHGTLQLPTKPNYLNATNKNIMSIIVNQFLTMQDILILRQTCRYFNILLLQPDKNNMVEFGSLCPEDVSFAWFDLKHFLEQSYYTAFASMEMFNIKMYYYAIVTRTPDKKIISWFNATTPYAQIIFEKTSKNEFAKEKDFDFRPKIYSTWAKITEEENVETGRGKNYDRNSSDIPSTLKNVIMISLTSHAFAALLKTRNVVTWGNKEHGGKIPHEIQNVKTIYSTDYAFAAILDDGSVFAWGQTYSGGKIPNDIQTQLINVKMISSTSHAFAALLKTRNVVTWGNEEYGGLIPHDIQPQLKNVTMIYSTNYAFAALLQDGSVLAWGKKDYGGKIPALVQAQLKHVTMIYSTCSAFAALLQDGSVLAWGDNDFGGNIPELVQNQLKKVKMIYSTYFAFAALLEDGSVFGWGDEEFGDGIPDSIRPKLVKNVIAILPKSNGFAALCKNGDIIEWGN